jgi:hypothetical protein
VGASISVGWTAPTVSVGAGASVASAGGDVGGGAGVVAWAQAASTNTPVNNIGKNLILRILELIFYLLLYKVKILSRSP